MRSKIFIRFFNVPMFTRKIKDNWGRISIMCTLWKKNEEPKRMNLPFFWREKTAQVVAGQGKELCGLRLQNLCLLSLGQVFCFPIGILCYWRCQKIKNGARGHFHKQIFLIPRQPSLPGIAPWWPTVITFRPILKWNCFFPSKPQDRNHIGSRVVWVRKQNL